MATTFGPARFIHSPPTVVAQPRKNQLIRNTQVICVMLQPNSFASGMRKTLQA